jgi:signal peptidase II
MFNVLKFSKTFFLILFFIFADQFLKYTIRAKSGFYICNENIAFGIVIPKFIFWPTITLAIIMLFLSFRKCFMPMCVSGDNTNASQKINPLFLAIASAGILSNLIDRFFFGCVIDFINLKVWPLFNLADAMIFTGIILLVAQNFKKSIFK